MGAGGQQRRRGAHLQQHAHALRLAARGGAQERRQARLVPFTGRGGAGAQQQRRQAGGVAPGGGFVQRRAPALPARSARGRRRAGSHVSRRPEHARGAMLNPTPLVLLDRRSSQISGKAAVQCRRAYVSALWSSASHASLCSAPFRSWAGSRGRGHAACVGARRQQYKPPYPRGSACAPAGSARWSRGRAGGAGQWEAHVVGSVPLGPAVQQHLQAHRMAPPRGHVQRRPAILAG